MRLSFFLFNVFSCQQINCKTLALLSRESASQTLAFRSMRKELLGEKTPPRESSGLPMVPTVPAVSPRLVYFPLLSPDNRENPQMTLTGNENKLLSPLQDNVTHSACSEGDRLLSLWHPSPCFACLPRSQTQL